jgi:hypothetical protein
MNLKKIFAIGLGIVFFVPFFWAGGYVTYLGVNDIRVGLAAVTWPAAAAHLETCDVTSHRSSKSTTYRAEVKYTYTVDGVQYTGDQLGVDYWSTSNRDTHAAHCQRVETMTPFIIRYRPDRRDISVIHPPEHPWISGKFFFGLAWLTIVTTIVTAFVTLVLPNVGRRRAA